MMSPEYFQTLAGYNTWANGLVYDAAARLPDSAYRRPRPAAYFSSLHGTLNHVLVGDRVWMSRFEAVESGVTGLDQILFDDLAELRAAREAEDARIERYTAGLTAEAIAGDLHFRTIVQPKEVTMPLWQTLGHFFNHQTHHRGQAHALLKDAGVEPPAIDLIYYLR